MRSEFDMIVIGAGMAGLNAAARAASAGRTVALVERDRLGGTCLLRGCIPTKALVRSAEIAHEIRRAAEFGIRVGEVEVDFAAVMERVRGIVDQGVVATRAWVESLDGVELIEGAASFSGPTDVLVGARVLRAPRIVIATGATPSVPPIPGLAETPHLVSDDILRLTELPRRLLVVGAGPVALELGQSLGRLGAQLTMVEVQPRLLATEEPELAEALGGYLAHEGLDILLGAEIERVAGTDAGGVRLVIRHEGRSRVLEGDALLVATGRAPVVADLDLAAAGITASPGVAVDAHLATRQPGIYAAGDVLGPPWGAFTPVARRLGVAAAEHALGLNDDAVDTEVGPRAIFTDPELATVGLTEEAARAGGHQVRIGSRRFSGGKARAWGEERGMVKIVAEAASGRLLGAHVLAYHGADLIHPLAVAMSMGVGAVEAIRRTPHVHPTLGEVIQAAVQATE
jgi:pyruvate/2-oxoglutarate dehydrogenase complex dihydrolipoamide dehydrogenase (E3) component